MKKRILFIVNPISGGQVKTFLPSMVDLHLDHTKFDAEIIFTEYVGHASNIARQAVDLGIDILASVGGDGTINEIASVVESTKSTMAIIPSGSGNGLARTLGIPVNKQRAIEQINRLQVQSIDCGTFNDRKFFNVAGIGFDAHISHLFATHATRGFKGYLQTVIQEVKNYRPQTYTITANGQTFQREAFMISIANSTQYGNNAHISPTASLTDGLLDLCIIKPFPTYKLPLLGYRMFSKTSPASPYVEIIKAEELIIKTEQSGPIHLDGEPLLFPDEINVGVKPLSLKILV